MCGPGYLDFAPQATAQVEQPPVVPQPPPSSVPQ
jgi:hypothetical protein